MLWAVESSQEHGFYWLYLMFPSSCLRINCKELHCLHSWCYRHYNLMQNQYEVINFMKNNEFPGWSSLPHQPLILFLALPFALPYWITFCPFAPSSHAQIKAYLCPWTVLFIVYICLHSLSHLKLCKDLTLQIKSSVILCFTPNQQQYLIQINI